MQDRRCRLEEVKRFCGPGIGKLSDVVDVVASDAGDCARAGKAEEGSHFWGDAHGRRRENVAGSLAGAPRHRGFSVYCVIPGLRADSLLWGTAQITNHAHNQR